jgi:phosphoribosylformylglycinamidine synthase
MKAIILVRLHESVVDSTGAAVTERLQEMGFSEVGSVRLGRLIEIELEGADKEALKGRIDRMCNRMLTNPEFEDYELYFRESRD